VAGGFLEEQRAEDVDHRRGEGHQQGGHGVGGSYHGRVKRKSSGGALGGVPRTTGGR
jgi:hypothetical protein